MAGTLVRLQLKLFRRGLAGQPAKIVGLAVLGVYLLGALVGCCALLVALRDAPLAARGAVTTGGFALGTVGWLLLPLLVSGSDQTLDPGRFALFPVRARQLMPGLLAAGLTGLGGIFTVVVALFQLVSWATSPATGAAALVAALVGVPTCVLLARTATAAFSAALSTRRYRDLAGIVLALAGVGVALGMQVFPRWAGSGIATTRRLVQAAEVTGWTPFGWAWAMPWGVAQRHWWQLGAHLLLSLLLLGVLWRLWEPVLDRALCSPLESGGGGGKVRSSALVDRLVPSGPVGAVAARTLRYWRRDPRHLVQAVMVAVMPALVVGPMLLDGGVQEDGAEVLAAPVFVLLALASLMVAQEISYDGSALWMVVSAGVRGRDDRLGRLVGFAWLMVPVTLAVALGSLALGHAWRHTPAMLGTCAAALLASAAVGSVTGALWQVPQPPPGQNAFSRSSGGGAAAMLMTFVSMIASTVLAAPVLALGLCSALWPWLGWVALVAGPLYGLAMVAVGVVWGGRVLDRSWPEVLRQVTYEKG